MVTRVYSCNFPLLQGKFPSSFHLFLAANYSVKISSDAEVVEGIIVIAFYEFEHRQLLVVENVANLSRFLTALRVLLAQ